MFTWDQAFLERRRAQNRAGPRLDTRHVTPSTRSFAQAIDRTPPERVPLLAAARPDLVEVARALDAAEAAALAIFLESADELGALAAAARAVEIPVLRADLLLEEFEVYESRAAGADAVVVASDLLARAARATHMTACEVGALTVQVHGARVPLRATLDPGFGASPDPAAAFAASLKE